MIKKSIIFFFFLSTFCYAEDPVFTQYYLDQMAHNPAISGSKPYNFFSLQSRQQWFKFHERAPLSSQISYHGMVNTIVCFFTSRMLGL